MLPKLAICLTLSVPLCLALEHIPITGAKIDPKFGGGVPLRRNINDLYAKGGPMWDLFIRSLQAMNDMDARDYQSFFQIAGIHGKPYVEWNNAGSKTTTGWEGYCPHGEQLFLSWHRAYGVLHEQELVRQAKKLADGYPDRYRLQYQKAANDLRTPFWDWAFEQAVPPATVPKTMKVSVPDGKGLKQIEVDNPLATFKFPEEALAGAFGSFDPENRTETHRCLFPDRYPDSANKRLQSRQYKQWTYDAFSRSTSFSSFTSTNTKGIGLEQIHNSIHRDGACGAQFTEPEFAGFDPLFILHHANVDRMWAYWEAINPNSRGLNQTYAGGPRYSTPGGTRITIDSALQPFFQANGLFHTPRTVENIMDFGYTYEGIEWGKSEAQMKLAATKLINRLYGPRTPSASALMTSQNQQTRFFVDLQLNVEQVERPCTVNVYVGGKFAGDMVVMQLPAKGIMRGGFSIDVAVQDAGIVQLATDSMMDSIESSLEVQILKSDKSTIPLSLVPSLQVELDEVGYLPPASEDVLATYGTPTTRVIDAVKDRSTGAIN